MHIHSLLKNQILPRFATTLKKCIAISSIVVFTHNDRISDIADQGSTRCEKISCMQTDTWI